jgi:hypothetical protein
MTEHDPRALRSTSAVVSIDTPGKIEFYTSSSTQPAYPHSITFDFDPKANQLNFNAELPVNSWLAIGFGGTMTNCDMILMQAFSTLASSKVSDLWSTSHSTPYPDKVDSLSGKQITEDKVRGT